jgi:D-glycero-D-manno-heptose 1,7-bisphosphate phosphatase
MSASAPPQNGRAAARQHGDARRNDTAWPLRETRRAVFIDKDGTLVENVPYNIDPALLRFTPHAFAALLRLQAAGYALFVITNQPGVALGRFDLGALQALQAALVERLADEGIALDGFYACTHAADADGRPTCSCRKPAPGLLHRAALEHNIALGRSWMVGDILDDIEAGRRAGCRTVLLDVGSETEWQLDVERLPHCTAGHLLEAATAIVDSDAADRAAGAHALEGQR